MVCASCLTRRGRVCEVLAWENILCAILRYIQSAVVLKCMIMCCEKKCADVNIVNLSIG